MGRTSTCHVSSKNNSVNSKSKLNNAFSHNLRKYNKNSDNYNKNKIIEIINTVRSANEYEKFFNNFFNKELEEYNSKQTRNDRKIDNYFKHCCGKSGDIAVELILQSCDKNYWKEHSDKRENMINVYKAQLEHLQEIVPNLVILNATFHNDEASPHLHIIALPYSAGYKKGLKKQCSKSKVFDKNKLEYLQDEMRSVGEKAMQTFIDKNFKYDEKSEGRNYDFKVSKYAELSKKIETDFMKGHKQEIEEKARQMILNSVTIDEEDIKKEKQNKINEKLNNFKIDTNEVKTLYLRRKFKQFDDNDELKYKIEKTIEEKYQTNLENNILIIDMLKSKLENFLKDYFEFREIEIQKILKRFFNKESKQTVKILSNIFKFEDNKNEIIFKKISNILKTVCIASNINFNNSNIVKNDTQINNRIK